MEGKIKAKIKAIRKAFLFRSSGSGNQEHGEKQFVTEMTQAMMSIVKKEVNIRLQAERHNKSIS